MSEESRNRLREEALARRLGEALDEQASPRGPEPCPDAELIAAYHERELGPEEIASCEMHFAACSRCRKILTVLAASDDTPLAEKEVARLGELVAAAHMPQEIAPRMPREAAPQGTTIIPPKRPDWRVRWLVPAVSIAAVLAVWFVIRPPWRAMEQGSSGTLIAQAPKNEPLLPPEPAPGNQMSQTAPAKKLATDSATSPTNTPAIPSDRSGVRMNSPAPLPREMAKSNSGEVGTFGSLSAGNPVAESAPQSEEKVSPGSNVAPVAGPPPPPPVTPPSEALAQARPNPAGQSPTTSPGVPTSTSQSVTVTGEAPLVSAASGTFGGVAGEKQSANLPLNGRNFQTLGALKTAGATSIQIRSPLGKVFWRIGKNGSIERSANAGGSWISQASPSTQDWAAGAAVSDTSCWIVGRNGSIARTTDGEHWEKVAPPSVSADAAGKFPDWTSVTATDTQNATITASDQRRFTTHDGGKTWQPAQNK